MPAVQRSSLPDQVFRELVGAVLDGRYSPGERLPTQRALAADLGVNMASVREGIKRLEQLKLVDVRQGDAMRVRDWRTHGGLDVLVHALGGGAALDDEVMRSVMEARGLLLAEAARLAAERRDEEQAALLERLAAEVAAAAGDDAAQGADFAFFATLIAASGNLVLLLVANSIRELYFARLEDFRALVRDRGALAGLYASAAEAVMAGDGDAAARAVGELTAAQEAAWLEGIS